MTEIIIADGKERALSFYLAMEEYVAAKENFSDAFFLWSVEPTVIFGRNQSMSDEVDVEWCREHDVRMFRRKSGGGCVYADKGNLMISCVLTRNDVKTAFSDYLYCLAEALRALGLPAEVSGRNDILLDGYKISGNAVQYLGSKSIVHGTLMYDVDFDALHAAITPSSAKLSAHSSPATAPASDAVSLSTATQTIGTTRSKAVQSVRRRVTNLKPYLDAASVSKAFDTQHPIQSLDDLHIYLAACLSAPSPVLDAGPARTHSQYILTSDDIARIEDIERSYLDPAFLYGKSAPDFSASEVSTPGGHVSTESVSERPGIVTHHRRSRIEGVGELDLCILTRAGLIESVSLSGDYFALLPPAEIDSRLTALLRGLPFPLPSSIAASSFPLVCPACILNLTPAALLELLS